MDFVIVVYYRVIVIVLNKFIFSVLILVFYKDGYIYFELWNVKGVWKEIFRLDDV